MSRENFTIAFYAAVRLRAEDASGECGLPIVTNQPEDKRSVSAGWVEQRYTTGGMVLLPGLLDVADLHDFYRRHFSTLQHLE